MDSGTTSPPAPSSSPSLDTEVSPNPPVPPPSAGSGSVATDVPTLKITPASPVDRPAISVPPQTVTLDHPKVVNTALLQAGDTSVTLYGIEGLTGAPAQGLQGFLASSDGKVACQAQETAGFVCLMSDGTNVAQAALVNGAAKTSPDAPDSYREQEASAQAARRGIWVNLPPPPQTVKHPVVRDTATLWADNQTFVLDGIVGFQAPYAGQLQGYIAASGDSVTCAPQAIPEHYICLLPDGTDVAKVALVNGAARVAPDAPDLYRVQQLDALNNRRGYWATAPQAIVTAALLPPEADPEYAFVAGDDGADGITYVGGEPMAIIDGEAAFLVLGAAGLGWGYYDHYHRWHGAPDRYREHLEHFHPDGRGLRGYDRFRHDAAFHGREEIGRHDEAIRGREEMVRHEEAVRGREEAIRRDAAFRGREEAVHPGAFRPGEARPGMARPGMEVAPGGRPSMAAGMARPGMAGPVNGGGFMRPMPAASAGGFHPAAAMAAAPHAAAPSSGGGKHR